MGRLEMLNPRYSGGELGPVGEPVLEPDERLDAEPVPVRVGRILDRVEHVPYRDPERDVADQTFADQRAKQGRGQAKFPVRVRVEELVLVKEAVEEAGEELVVVRLLGVLGALELVEDLVDRNLLLVHALVVGVDLGLGLRIESRDGHTGLGLAVGQEAHEFRVELDRSRADLLERLDLLLR